ncbi:MAG: DUF4145 domain-containing protein [Candidatus Thorarchaeota archaeon]
MAFENLSVDKYCPYCHKYTLILPVPTEYKIGEKRILCIHKSRDMRFIYWLGKCHSCKGIVMVVGNGMRVYPEIMPKPSDERIPEKIRYSLDEAKRCFEVEAYCASTVMSRRALQICCVDKGVDEEKRLVEQINDLFDMGIITKDIKEIAHTVRWIGNDGAHLNPNEVTKEDAEDILKLTDQIFNIIYIAPAMAKERLEKREQALDNQDE